MATLYKELLVQNIFTGYTTKAKDSWLSLKNFEWDSATAKVEAFTAFYSGPYEVIPTTKLASICNMGAFSYSHSALHPRMTVGRFCSIARGLEILDFSHPIDRLSSSVGFFVPEGTLNPTPLPKAIGQTFRTNGPVPGELFDPLRASHYPVLGNDVWIGQNVTLAMGITVGTGSIIAANSLVTRDVPPYSIVAGLPARVIRKRFPDELATNLLESRWWEFDYTQLRELDFNFPEKVVNQIQSGNLSNAHYPAISIQGGQVTNVHRG